MEKKEKEVKKSVLKKDEFKKYFFWAIVLILIFLSYLIIKPYSIALISAFILAYLIRPVERKLEPRLGKSLSSIISILLIFIALIIPISLIIGGVIQQANTYVSGESFNGLLEKASTHHLLKKLNINLESLSDSGLSLIPKLISGGVSVIPSIIISLFITVFGMFYILSNWNEFARNLKRYIPFKNKNLVSKEISTVTNIMVYGTLLLALVEFLVAGIGFYLLGMKFYLLLAALIFFFAFIPAAGPTLVWIPAAIYYLILGDTLVTIGIVIIGLILSVIIDSIMRAKILGSKAKINPVVMLVGILGGISVFGIFGFIIGPLILSYTIEIIQETIKND